MLLCPIWYFVLSKFILIIKFYIFQILCNAVVVAPEKTIIDPESPLSVPAPEPEPEMDPAEGLDPDDPRLFLFGVCYSSDDCCPGSDCFFPRLSQGYMLCIAPTDQIYPNIYHVDPLLGRGCN